MQPINNQIKKPKEEVTTRFENGKMYETKKLNGKISTVTIFEDINKNGAFEENEIVKVERYYYDDDGSYTKKSFIDNDNDGYSDSVWTSKYDKNGHPVGNLRQDIEKNINDLKMDYEKHNRKMQTHRDGYYMC